MYNVNIKNSYCFDVTVGGKVIPAGGGSGSTGAIGNAVIEIPGIGSCLALDLGDKQIPGYTLPGTWGVLFRFKTLEIYARYEGQPNYDLVIDEYGDITITLETGSAKVIELNELNLIS